MTEKSVRISITVKVNDEVIEYTRKVRITELEEELSKATQEIGNKAMVAMIEGLDREMRQRVPARWQNVGTEERSLMSSLGRVRYRRHIYRDEKGVRRKPVDEILGVERYSRESQRVREMGAYLASEGTYWSYVSKVSLR